MKNLYILIITLITFGVSNAQTAHSAELTWSAFGGTTATGNVHEFPTGAEGWAGFANTNSSIYPLDFSTAGAKITFTASAADNVVIRFKVENAPHPDVDPSKDLGTVTVVGGAEAATYTVTNSDPDTHPYKSLLLYVDTRDVAVTMTNFVIYSDDTFNFHKVKDFDLSLYPNPATDVVRISAGETIDMVRVYDLTGRSVMKSHPNKSNFSLDVADLSKGVYLVKLNAGNKQATTKLTK